MTSRKTLLTLTGRASVVQIPTDTESDDKDDIDAVAPREELWFDEGEVWWSRPQDGPPSMRGGS